MTFEDKIKLLEEIVKELESGEVPLDDAINKYTEAMKLAKECSDKLNKVSEKVNKIMLENGKLEDFTVSEQVYYLIVHLFFAKIEGHMNEIITRENIKIEDMIFEIRGKQVMLDLDLALLYECKNGTKEMNQPVSKK